MTRQDNQLEPYQKDTVQDDKMVARIDSMSNLAKQTTQLASQLNLSGMVDRVADMYAECKRIEAQTELVKAWSQVEIVKTVAKYKSCQEFMFHTFGERDKALTKHYDLLDKAIISNDKDHIIAALQGIGGIVTKSPLQDIEQFARLFEDTSQPLLDF